MVDAALFVLAEPGSSESIGRLVNALEAGKEFSEADGDDIEIVFDGAATQWIGELEDESHDYHELYAAVREEVVVCDYCASAYGVDDAVDGSGVTRLDEYDGHPSVRSFVAEGYEVLTF